MDIVDRIKLFIKESGITVSQFADSCEIARPTVSQLLNGRNKKVSDEIFRKIHAAYPTLSINWLLFGEGEMGGVESSGEKLADELEPQDGEQKANSAAEDADDLENRILGGLNSGDIMNIDGLNLTNTETMERENALNFLDGNLAQKNFLAGVNVGVQAGGASVPVKERKIVNILVFYSDNSFEYFSPSPRPVQK